MFSGFVKAVDPWGGMYKMHEYMIAFDMHLSYEADCTLAVLLAACEFTLGVCVMCGVMRRVTTWCLAAFMAVMTPLTLWIWLTDPVADCGCFGDALVLSNGATFAKNVVLCVLTALLIIYNARVRPSIDAPRQWLALIFSLVYAGALSMVGYNRQPVIDFRPYKVGTAICEEADDDDARFVYERGGVVREFSADSLPGDDWTYVDRVQTSANHALSVFDSEGEDVTDEVLKVENAFILVVNDVPRHGISRARMQNNIHAYADSSGYDMFALLAVQPGDLDAWADRLHAEYPVYAADDSDLKELVRGDAALVVVKDGSIADKSNLYAYGPDEFTPGMRLHEFLPLSRIFWRLTGTYLVLMLILLSSLPITKPRIKRPVQDKND